MKYHGLYCGPNWSAGKHQQSVLSGLSGVDELDELCRVHDAAYATRGNLKAADRKFFISAMKLPTVRAKVAGILVGIQGAFRANDMNVSMPNQKPKNQVEKIQQDTIKWLEAELRSYADIGKPVMKTSTPVKGGSSKIIPPPPIDNLLPIPYIPNFRMSKNKNKNRDKSIAIPAARATTSRMTKPKTSSRGGGVVLSHRGLISGFVGSTTFNAVNYQVNPGMAGVFPWAAQLARSYDKYRFTKLKFSYRSVVPTTTAGVVMMSFDYDTLDILPTTKFEHSQSTPNVESNSFNSFELDVKCDNVWRFVRQGAIASTDLKTYDFGQLVVSSSYATASLLGEIYVEYTVELDKPSHGVPVFAHISCASTGVASPFGTSTLTGPASPVTLPTTSTMKFIRPGEYLLAIRSFGTGLANVLTPTFVSPASAGSVVAVVEPQVVDAAGTNGMCSYKVRAGAGDVINWASYQNATTLTASRWDICECDYASV